MLKKLRRRFIAVAMAAFSMVIVLLLFIIQVSNYRNITTRQDNIIQIMQRNPSYISSGRFPIIEYDGLFTLFYQYSLRFFIIKTNNTHEIQQILQEPATLISEKDAINYATHVLSSTRTKGYHNHYRYFIQKTPAGNTIYFLDSEQELQLLQSLFWSTTCIALCSLLVIFSLSSFFQTERLHHSFAI